MERNAADSCGVITSVHVATLVIPGLLNKLQPVRVLSFTIQMRLWNLLLLSSALELQLATLVEGLE